LCHVLLCSGILYTVYLTPILIICYFLPSPAPLSLPHPCLPPPFTLTLPPLPAYSPSLMQNLILPLLCPYREGIYRCPGDLAVVWARSLRPTGGQLDRTIQRQVAYAPVSDCTYCRGSSFLLVFIHNISASLPFLKLTVTPRLGKPVLSLDYLMDTIVTKLKPLDWDVFWNKQKNNTQVLKVSLGAVCVCVCGGGGG
jgi:hypothetical protein